MRGTGGDAARDPQPPPGRLSARPEKSTRASPSSRRHRPGTVPAGSAARPRASLGPGAGLGEAYGYRNAQVTVIAPTGTIGLVMDCDTTGIEPDFALVKFKKLAGGGYFKIINQACRWRWSAGLHRRRFDDIVAYCAGRRRCKGAPHINHESLQAKGFDEGGWSGWRARLDAGVRPHFAFNRGRSATSSAARTRHQPRPS